MVQNRITKPRVIHRPSAKITGLPESIDAQNLLDTCNYLSDFCGHYQVYTYSGPGPGTDGSLGGIVPDYDFYDDFGLYQDFPIILHSSPKRDIANPYRRLTGVLIPWRVVPGYYKDYCNKPSRVLWNHLDKGVSADREIYRGKTFYPQNWMDVDQWSLLRNPPVMILRDCVASPDGGICIDGHMEYPITDGFWISGNSASISKDTSTYHSGTQSLKVMHNGTDLPYAQGIFLNETQQIKTGCDYTVSIWVKSDGASLSRIICGSDVIVTGSASTAWQELTADFTAGGSDLKLQAVTSTITNHCWFDDLIISEKGRFQYTPDVDGLFTVGHLRIDRMRVAALSVFHAPDLTLSDDQPFGRVEDFAKARAIRGYTGTGQPSLGDLEYGIGQGGTSYDVDDVERCTRRCLLQSGHPTGISTYLTGSYYNIRGGNDSYFKITPRNLKGETSGTISTIPCLYGECHGASMGTPAKIKYTALTSGDTWELYITSDTAALWYDTARLEVRSTGDKVKIEVQAPEDGWIRVKTYSLWEDSYSN